MGLRALVSGRRPWWLLLLLALSLRLVTVPLLYTPHAAPVTYEHGAIAENLLAGKGFSVTFLGTEGPTSQQAPLYPFLLAALYFAFGVESSAAIVAMQLLQCVAGTAVVACVIWLTSSLAPARPGVVWLSGLGAAIYPPHVYAVTHVQVAIWTALCLTLLLAVAAATRWTVPWLQPVVAGLIAGILLLFDPIMLVTLPVVAVWIAIGMARERRELRDSKFDIPLFTPQSQTEEQRPGLYQQQLRRALSTVLAQREKPVPEGPTPPVVRRAAPAVLMLLVALLVILPWLVRNYLVHGEVVFIKSTFGYAFWQGNNPASWGTDKVPKASVEQLRRDHSGVWRDQERALWEARHETLYIDDVLLKPGGYAEFTGLSEPQRSRLLGARAWKFIVTHPAGYLRLCLQRLRYFLLFDETNPKAAHWLYRVSTVVWLGLTLTGPVMLWRQWRTWWPLYAVFAAVMLFHVLTIVSARFRIPVEPLTFCWAAVPVAAAAERLRRVTLQVLSRTNIGLATTLCRVNTGLGRSRS
jgi:hypothetical protein